MNGWPNYSTRETLERDSLDQGPGFMQGFRSYQIAFAIGAMPFGGNIQFCSVRNSAQGFYYALMFCILYPLSCYSLINMSPKLNESQGPRFETVSNIGHICGPSCGPNRRGHFWVLHGREV